jgi:hypothetical protein
LRAGGGGERFRADGRQSLGLGGVPKGRRAAALAEAKDTFIGGADVRFDAGIVHFFESLTRVADEREEAEFPFDGRQGRKFDVPEFEAGIHEGHAVGVDALLSAELADDTDFRFLVELRATEDHLLFGAELMTGEEARAVEAKEDGLGGLGENAAAQIAADQDDGDFLRNASAAAHNLLWQAGSQSSARGEPI